jgi:hypothetical protein
MYSWIVRTLVGVSALIGRHTAHTRDAGTSVHPQDPHLAALVSKSLIQDAALSFSKLVGASLSRTVTSSFTDRTLDQRSCAQRCPKKPRGGVQLSR